MDNTRLGQTGQINEGETENVWRIDFEVDGLAVDAFVAAGYPGRLILNLSLDLAKVVELASRDVAEFTPLVLAGYARGRVWNVDVVAFGPVVSATGDVDELQDQRPAGDDAAATGEEVPADNVLEDG